METECDGDKIMLISNEGAEFTVCADAAIRFSKTLDDIIGEIGTDEPIPLPLDTKVMQVLAQIFQLEPDNIPRNHLNIPDDLEFWKQFLLAINYMDIQIDQVWDQLFDIYDSKKQIKKNNLDKTDYHKMSNFMKIEMKDLWQKYKFQKVFRIGGRRRCVDEYYDFPRPRICIPRFSQDK